MPQTAPHNPYDFQLPADLIADYPAHERSASRLLHVRADGGLRDTRFAELPALLRAGDLLVVNDSRVIAARLHARKAGGGGVSILIERLAGPRRALAHLRANRPPRRGAVLHIGNCELRVGERRRDLFTLSLDDGDFNTLLQRHGETPLPPYIRRKPEALDAERYQTVYARHPGSVAAPTAGLHFDRALLAQLRDNGVDAASLTLHIGAGTFQPLRGGAEQHRMHREVLHVGEALCDAVAACRKRRGRVVAVGTTVARGLETAAGNGAALPRPFSGETGLFIQPGFRFRAVDALITNFHLPRTTLFVLVCAFAGRERMLAAYRHAIGERYRFFSYGDATWLDKNDGGAA